MGAMKKVYQPKRDNIIKLKKFIEKKVEEKDKKR